MGDDLPAVDLGTERYAVAVTCGRWHTCVLLDNNDVKVHLIPSHSISSPAIERYLGSLAMPLHVSSHDQTARIVATTHTFILCVVYIRASGIPGTVMKNNLCR